MAKMKSVYLPIPFVGFEQSFLANVICKKGALPGADEETFVGKHSGSKFIFALYRSDFYMKVNAVPEGSGTMLTYQYKIHPAIWVVLSLTFLCFLFLLYSCFTMDLASDMPNLPNWLSFFLSTRGINVRIVLLLAVAIVGSISMVRKKDKIEKKLLHKLGEICCGMLPAEEEVDHNG